MKRERKPSEEAVEATARNVRVINEASDGKVSEYAYELSKEVLRGNITDKEAVKKVFAYYGV